MERENKKGTRNGTEREVPKKDRERNGTAKFKKGTGTDRFRFRFAAPPSSVRDMGETYNPKVVCGGAPPRKLLHFIL